MPWRSTSAAGADSPFADDHAVVADVDPAAPRAPELEPVAATRGPERQAEALAATRRAELAVAHFALGDRAVAALRALIVVVDVDAHDSRVRRTPVDRLVAAEDELGLERPGRDVACIRPVDERALAILARDAAPAPADAAPGRVPRSPGLGLEDPLRSTATAVLAHLAVAAARAVVHATVAVVVAAVARLVLRTAPAALAPAAALAALLPGPALAVVLTAAPRLPLETFARPLVDLAVAVVVDAVAVIAGLLRGVRGVVGPLVVVGTLEPLTAATRLPGPDADTVLP